MLDLRDNNKRNREYNLLITVILMKLSLKERISQLILERKELEKFLVMRKCLKCTNHLRKSVRLRRLRGKFHKATIHLPHPQMKKIRPWIIKKHRAAYFDFKQ